MSEEEAAAKEAERKAEGDKNKAMLQAIPQNVKGLAQVKSSNQATLEVEIPS